MDASHLPPLLANKRLLEPTYQLDPPLVAEDPPEVVLRHLLGRIADRYAPLSAVALLHDDIPLTQRIVLGHQCFACADIGMQRAILLAHSFSQSRDWKLFETVWDPLVALHNALIHCDAPEMDVADTLHVLFVGTCYAKFTSEYPHCRPFQFDPHWLPVLEAFSIRHLLHQVPTIALVQDLADVLHQQIKDLFRGEES